MTTLIEEKPSFGKQLVRALGWLLKFLLRLFFVVFIGAGLGLALYLAAVYGVQLFNTQLLQPIRDNNQRLDDLETYRMNDLETYDVRIVAIQKQVDALISQGDNNREYLDSLDSRLADAEDAVDDALLSITATQTDLDSLTAETGKVSPRLDELDDALSELELATKELSVTLTEAQDELTAVTEKVDDERALTVLRNDVMILKAMEALSRARLFLFQNNSGLASEEIIAARDVLLILKGMVPDFQKDAVQAILDRLGLARDNLTTAPNIAVDDLEAAWQQMLIGLPAAAPQGVSLTVAPTATLTATLELSPTLALTSTGVITTTSVVTP